MPELRAQFGAGDMRVQPPDPPLSDGVVLLRPFVPEDAPRIAEICNDPDMGRWILTLPYPYTVAHAAWFIESTRSGWHEGAGYEFAIVDAASGRQVGSIGLHTPAHRPAVGYMVGHEDRGRGIATRALRLVCRWGFEQLGLDRISLWTLPGNAPSQRVAEKVGFRYEGVLRDWERGRDGPVDGVMFGLTRDDWADLDAQPAAGTTTGVARTPPELLAPGTRAAPFVDVAPVADMPPGSMRRITLAGVDLLVAHTPDGIVVTDDRCPHMSAPLSIGELEGCVVACPLHEGRFDLCSGETVRMPTTGGLDADGNYHAPWSPTGASPKAEPPSKKLEARRLTRVHRLRYYPTRIRDGHLEVQLPIAPE